LQPRHVVAGQHQTHVQRTQFRRIGQRSLDPGPRAADAYVGLERERLAGVAQAQRGAGLARRIDRGLVVMADDLPADAITALGFAFRLV